MQTCIGLGHYPLKNWFHLSLPASYTYANAGAVTTLTSILIWGLSHLVWIVAGEPCWAITISVVIMFSSTAYAMAFARQNYQILDGCGYSSPLFLGNYAYMSAAFFFFATGLSGITPIFFAVPIVATLAYTLFDPWLLIALLPAVCSQDFASYP